MAVAKTKKITWRRGIEDRAPRDYVLFTVATPCTHADIVQKIAERLKLRIEGHLPKILRRITFEGAPRTVSGSATVILDQISAYHENLHWAYSGGAVRFEVRDGRKELSPFDELAGRLMRDARRTAKGQILHDEYRRVTTELEGFKPQNFLEGRDRKSLAVWNQAHPRVAVHTFSKAYEHPRFRRAVLRRLNRAQEKYVKTLPVHK